MPLRFHFLLSLLVSASSALALTSLDEALK